MGRSHEDPPSGFGQYFVVIGISLLLCIAGIFSVMREEEMYGKKKPAAFTRLEEKKVSDLGTSNSAKRDEALPVFRAESEEVLPVSPIVLPELQGQKDIVSQKHFLGLDDGVDIERIALETDWSAKGKKCAPFKCGDGGPGKLGQDVWVFDSGVRLIKKFLTEYQISRFESEGNFWEADDEAYISAILTNLSNSNVTNPVVVDVGAAYGYYSLLSAVIAPAAEVHAINPHPKFVDQMLQNLAENKANQTVTVHQVALADYEGFASLNYGVGHQLDENDAEINSRVLTFDVFAQNNFIGKTLYFVKLDVEHFEARVLRTSRGLLGSVKYWSIGTHSKELREECEEILRDAGYEIIRSEDKDKHDQTHLNGGIVAKLPYMPNLYPY